MDRQLENALLRVGPCSGNENHVFGLKGLNTSEIVSERGCSMRDVPVAVILVTLLLPIFFLVYSPIPIAQSQYSWEGTWEVTGETDAGTPQLATMTLKQDGDKVTGTGTSSWEGEEIRLNIAGQIMEDGGLYLVVDVSILDVHMSSDGLTFFGYWGTSEDIANKKFEIRGTRASATPLLPTGIHFEVDVHLANEPVVLFEPVMLALVINWERPPGLQEPKMCHVDVSVSGSYTSHTKERPFPIMTRPQEFEKFTGHLSGEFAKYSLIHGWDFKTEDPEGSTGAEIKIADFTYPGDASLRIVVTLTPPGAAKPVTFEKKLNFELQVAPSIAEEVRKALAQKWYKRWTTMGWEGKIEDLYDFLDSSETELNTFCAYTALALKMKGGLIGSVASEVVDQLEDVLDLSKAGYLAYKGYYAQASLDILFKVLPDVSADVVGAALPGGFMLSGATIGIAAAGTLGLGPFGIGVLMVLGAYGGYKGGQAAGEALEIGACYLENWWEANKDKVLKQMGAAQYQNLYKMMEASQESTSDRVINLKKVLSLLKVKSDGYLHVYDSQGRHTGPDGQGNIEAGIPGSCYVRFDEIKVTLLALGTGSTPVDEYRFEVEGKEEGHYSLSVLAASEGSVKTLIDVEDAEMEIGKTYATIIDTADVFTNVDTTPPAISNLALSKTIIRASDADQTISITVEISDNNQILSVGATLTQNGKRFSYTQLMTSEGKYSGEILIPADLPEGEYHIQVVALDQTGNGGTSEKSITVEGGRGKSDLFFEVTSLSGVSNDPPNAVTFTVDWPLVVTLIRTYHWNDGRGTSTLGEIGLIDQEGTTYGPWEATGEIGGSGAPNAYWVVEPNIELPPGEYMVVDSDPASWSWNEETQGRGITWVYAILQTQFMQLNETTTTELPTTTSGIPFSPVQSVESTLPGGYVTIVAAILVAAGTGLVLLRKKMRKPPPSCP